MKTLISAAFLLALALGYSQAQWSPHCVEGRRTIVHLFEWRWDDIALECERFLQYKGFCGVQVSPPNEYLVYMSNVEKRPWWERYQPVSYKTYSRSGDEAAFINMLNRCNNVGVRVYVDLLLNHMCNKGAGKGVGVGGSDYNADTWDFPEVAYNKSHFNSKTSSPNRCDSPSGDVEQWGNPTEVRNCHLLGLLDMDQSQAYVRDKQVAWMDYLTGIGVAGFRLDAAKHMWPHELKQVLDRLKDLPSKWFGANARPFIYQEVIDHGGEQIKYYDYTGFGRVTEFNYGGYVSDMMKGHNQLKWLKTFGEGWGYLMPSDHALVFIDNHDTQRSHSHILNFFDSRRYKMAVTYMLSWPYGVARVMSSYAWPRNYQNGQDVNSWYGPPHDANYNIKNVQIDSEGGCGEWWKGEGWVCEHRWRQITNMAEFRGVVGDEPVKNWWDDWNQIAFSRGSRGFYAINAETSRNMDVWLQTGMAAGNYCDVISGNISEDKRSCTGKVVKIEADGKTNIKIAASSDDPMVAFHINSKLVN